MSDMQKKSALCAYLEKTETVRLGNFRIAELYSSLLNVAPTAVDGGMINEVVKETGVTPSYAYYVALSTLFALDEDTNTDDKAFLHKYLLPSVTCLSPENYKKNPYYATIRMTKARLRQWELTEKSYAPYEAFIFNDLAVLPDLTEIPQLGFFESAFSFPAVLQNGREWMTVTPNEIETMRQPIEEAFGHTVTFGLGLGYFAFMASNKPDVTSLTVVERDPDVIAMFEKHLLPQFPHGEKINVVKADAFHFMKDMRDGYFDYAFADIWHDAGDGLPLYCRMKRAERDIPHTRFSYWIERSILARLRWSVFADVRDAVKEHTVPVGLPEIRSEDDVKVLLTDDGLRRLVSTF